MAKALWRLGERNNHVVLTLAKVRAIRRRYARGNVTHRELGQAYGVSHSTIGQVTRLVTWNE